MPGRELAAVFRLHDEFSGEAKRISGLLSNLEASFGGISAKALAAGGAMGLTLGATVELGRAAFELGEQFDAAGDTIILKSAATGEALGQLQQDFQDLAGRVPSSLQDAADAIALLNARTGETGAPLQALAEQVLTLSRLTGTDLHENIRATARLFGDWSVAVDQQALTLDKLFVAAKNSGVSVTELAQNVVQFGAPMRQLGIDLDTAIALFSKWEKEGVNVETVAATMRIAVARLAEAGLEPKQAFEGLLTTIRDMEDPVAATTLAMQIFGQRGGADMAAAIREGRFSVDDLVKAIQGAGGAVQQGAKDTDDAAQTMQESLNRLKLAFKPIGDAAFQMTSDVANALAEMATLVTRADVDTGTKLKALAQSMQQQGVTSANPAEATAGAALGGAVTLGEWAKAGNDAANAFLSGLGDKLGQIGDTLMPPDRAVGGSWADAGADAADSFGDGLANEMPDAIDQAMEAARQVNLAPFQNAFDRELEHLDLAGKFGEVAADAMDAFSHAVEGDPKAPAAMARAAAKLIEELRKVAVPDAEALAADIASTLAAAYVNPTDTAAGAAALAALQAAGQGIQDERQRQAEAKQQQAQAEREAAEAKRQAAAAEREAQREQAAAVREAERILAEQERQAAREAEIEAQRANAIREAGQRLVQAREEADTAYDAAVHKANQKATEQIHLALEQFNREQDIQKERQRLQDQATAGLDALREQQAMARQATSDTRSGEDVAIRRRREDEDLATRQAQRAVTERQAEAQDQARINAARLAGDTRATVAAMLAAEQRKKSVKDQADAEIAAITLRRQREDEDIERSRQRRAEDVEQAKKDAKDLADTMKELNAPLEAFNQQILEDNLASKIQEYAKAKREAVDAATQLRTSREGQAEQQFNTAVERANNIGVPQTVIFNNYNNGLQSPETIEDMVNDFADAAAQRLALTGA